MIINGDCLEELDKLDENSIDAIVTDPPYGLTSITKRFGKEGSAPAKYGKDGSFARLSKGFMGKEWDGSGIEYNVEMWQKCLKVLKPGGYLLAFGGTRTYHRIACAVEDAGFEIRDCIMWLYGSGFPKSMNIGLAVDKKNGVESEVVGLGKSGKPESHTRSLELKDRPIGGEYEIKKAKNEWDGWGTALKPSYEPIIVARKPFKGSLVDNVIKYGVGGLNIDECRVGNEKLCNSYAGNKNSGFTSGDERDDKGKGLFSGIKKGKTIVNGRFPANTILTYGETDFDEVCGGFPNTKGGGKVKEKGTYGYCFSEKRSDKPMADGYDDSGSAARYFYCAKTSNRDNEEHYECEKTEDTQGRFPANTILTYNENDYEEVCGGFPYTKSNGGKRNDEKTNSSMNVPFADHKSGEHYKDSGSAARYFYCAKASKKDRDEGLEELEEKKTGELQGGRKEGSAGSIMLNENGTTRVNPYAGTGAPKKNFHPTVKPTSLMQYLIRLVAPKGATILDPFMGSGSTGKAVMYENKERNANYKFIGIEKDTEYCKIAEARIKNAELDK